MENLKYSEKTVANCIWICTTFPPETRNPNLTFSHHAIAASLKPKDREWLFDAAEIKKLTTNDMIDLKRELFPKASSPKEAEFCVTCGQRVKNK